MPRSTVATAATTPTARRSSGRGRLAWSMAGSARSTARPPAAEHAWAPATCRGVPALSSRRTSLPCRDSAVMAQHARRRADPRPFRLELDLEPEPPASAAPIVCFRCRGAEAGCPVFQGAGVGSLSRLASTGEPLLEGHAASFDVVPCLASHGSQWQGMVRVGMARQGMVCPGRVSLPGQFSFHTLIFMRSAFRLCPRQLVYSLPQLGPVRADKRFQMPVVAAWFRHRSLSSTDAVPSSIRAR